MPPDVFAWNTLYFRPGGDRNNHAYVDSHTLTLASSSNPVSQQPRTSRAGATSNHHCQRSEQSHIFSVLYGRFGSFYVCSEPTASAAKAHELYKQQGGLKKARELYEEARGALFGRPPPLPTSLFACETGENIDAGDNAQNRRKHTRAGDGESSWELSFLG